MEDKIRPEIANAWQRCKSTGLDPWSLDFPKPSEKLLRKSKRENMSLLEIASPIMEYLMLLFNCNISLSDSRGFIFELFTPLGSYPRTLGTIQSEDKVGNGNITLALHNKKPIRVDGFEHYRVISQNYSGVSAPIIANSKDLLAIININNPFNLLPPYTLDSCIEAARIIERVYSNPPKKFDLFSTPNLFENLINIDKNSLIILNGEGRILMTNRMFAQNFTGKNGIALGDQSIKEILVDKSLFRKLVDCSTTSKLNNIIEFKLKNKRKITMNLLRKSNISLPNGFKHIVLVFNSEQSEHTKINTRSLRQNSVSVDYIGQSSAWKKIDNMVHKVAKHKANVLLLGETGTGKEVVAKAIHRNSGRTGNFVALNCGSIPRDLLGSELFGYEGGSFTGARNTGAIGKFEWANGGTLFLDEIGEMPIDMQVSLLRVLQEQTITRIGSNKPIPIDTHIIAATNKDMHKLIGKGKFRSDLYYRLSIFEIQLPLLKNRKEDIPLLADFFNKELSKQLNISFKTLSDKVMLALINYDWPGNVRELKNVIEKLLILADSEPITIDLIPDYLKNDNNKEYHAPEIKNSSNKTNRNKTKDRVQIEEEVICRLLEEHKGNISRVAEELNICRNTLYRKIDKLGIKMKFFRSN